MDLITDRFRESRVNHKKFFFYYPSFVLYVSFMFCKSHRTSVFTVTPGGSTGTGPTGFLLYPPTRPQYRTKYRTGQPRGPRKTQNGQTVSSDSGSPAFPTLTVGHSKREVVLRMCPLQVVSRTQSTSGTCTTTTHATCTSSTGTHLYCKG